MVDTRFNAIENPTDKYLNAVRLTFKDVDEKDGQIKDSQGSGYIYSPHLIFTAGHNLTGQKPDDVIRLKYGSSSDANGQFVNSTEYKYIITTADGITNNPDIAYINPDSALPFKGLGADTPGIITYAGTTVPLKLVGLKATSFGYPGAPSGAIDKTHIPGNTLYEVSGTIQRENKSTFLLKDMANWGGQSGSPVFVEYNNSKWIVGVLTHGDQGTEDKVSNNSHGTNINGDIFNRAIKILKSDYPNWQDAPKMMIFGADKPSDRAEIEIKSTFSSDTVYAGTGYHQIYASTGNDLFITETYGRSTIDYAEKFEEKSIKVKEFQISDGHLVSATKKIGGLDAGHDTYDGAFEIKLASDNGAVKFVDGSVDGAIATVPKQSLILDANINASVAQKTLDFSKFSGSLVSGNDTAPSDNMQFVNTPGLSSLEFKNFESIWGTDNGDSVTLGATIKIFEAGNGTNSVKAALANGVSIFGGAGDDTIIGNGTNGYLDGGRGGHDHMTGSENGADNFIWSGGDLVIDTVDGLDKLFVRADLFQSSDSSPKIESSDHGIQIKGGIGNKNRASIDAITEEFHHTEYFDMGSDLGVWEIDNYAPKYIYNSGDELPFVPRIGMEMNDVGDLVISFQKATGEYTDPSSGISRPEMSSIDGKITVKNFKDGDLGFSFLRKPVGQQYDENSWREEQNSYSREYFEGGNFKPIPVDHYDVLIV
ncbi:hypothetical protein [Methylobacterium gossipiicola]|uniref:V8-like Glu-specific endopeptidase n=1 Tax=Methylobacterium gossipiicola TaxID=582675 RepID=A0A1I2UYG1_9HYPH|nr:hypothetical protein [Methylobacterium gossipiicola]SFG80006.1 V8-like Glu-specific endopeptidase [Methylobacterium gossipiicola]